MRGPGQEGGGGGGGGGGTVITLLLEAFVLSCNVIVTS